MMRRFDSKLETKIICDECGEESNVTELNKRKGWIRNIFWVVRLDFCSKECFIGHVKSHQAEGLRSTRRRSAAAPSVPQDIDAKIKAHKIARDTRSEPTTTRLMVSDENGNRSYETVDNYWLYGDR